MSLPIVLQTNVSFHCNSGPHVLQYLQCLYSTCSILLQLGASYLTVSTASILYLQYFTATRGLVSHSIYSIYTESTVFHSFKTKVNCFVRPFTL
jgi:hypothetical protein